MNSFVVACCIGFAGALGAVARYLIMCVTSKLLQFPLGTLFINISGAFLSGLLFSLTTRQVVTPLLQSILATGFLGGFTTFSTMSWEGTQLARAGNVGQSFLYLAASFTLGLAAALLGIMIGKSI
jgi:CrcB protein